MDNDAPQKKRKPAFISSTARTPRIIIGGLAVRSGNE